MTTLNVLRVEILCMSGLGGDDYAFLLVVKTISDVFEKLTLFIDLCDGYLKWRMLKEKRLTKRDRVMVIVIDSWANGSRVQVTFEAISLSRFVTKPLCSEILHTETYQIPWQMEPGSKLHLNFYFTCYKENPWMSRGGSTTAIKGNLTYEITLADI